MRLLYLCLVVGAGCAQGRTRSDDVEIDASVARPDSGATPTDSNVGGGADAAGSGGCVTMTRNVLRNGSFEGTPVGVDWNATPIDASYPLITNQSGGVAAQSPAYRAWMGGLERTASTNKDVLYQDITLPAMVSKLELKGYYDLRTGEIGTTVYDRATVELTTVTNTQLELIKALDDNGATTAWTAFTKMFTGTYSGQTVRVRLSTASDSFDPTSFFFDTLELNATYCQ
jgi:hypothetical protein